jgi:hypothetical protein
MDCSDDYGILFFERITDLKRLINKKRNWRDIAEELIKIKKLELNQRALFSFSENEFERIKVNWNPGKVFVEYLFTKGVSIEELFQSFLRLEFDEAVNLFDKPIEPILVKKGLEQDQIYEHLDEIKLDVEVYGFPRPTYAYYKDGKKVGENRQLIIPRATYKDSGIYECCITQDQTNKTLTVSTKITVKRGILLVNEKPLFRFIDKDEIKLRVDIFNVKSEDDIIIEWFKLDADNRFQIDGKGKT